MRQRAYTTPVLLAPDDAMLTAPTVPVQFLNGLGVAAAYNRRLSDITPFLKYFPKASYNDPFYYKGRKLSTLQAVQFADNIVRNTLADTKRFANEVIADSSVYQVCKNLYDWLYRYVQYKKDADGVEQLRRPARTIAESKQGVDCDCFSIFISSCLTNLGIPHYFRVIAIEGKDHLQHIYVVVPTKQVLGAPNTGNGFITIDPVLDTFDAEADNITAYYDYFMDVPAYSMNGLGNASDGLTDIFNSLVIQRNSIIANPAKYQAAGYNPRAMVEMFDLAIDNFWTPNRDATLDMLARNDHQTLLNPAMSGLNGMDGLFDRVAKGVTQAAQQVKEVVKNPGAAAQNVINQVKDKLNIPQNVLNFIQNVIDTGKEVALFIPRKAFMALVALNFRALATNLKKALEVPEQRKRLQDMWEKGFGGDFQNLINVINNGAKNKMLFGLGALGTGGAETVAATVAEATPVLANSTLATIISAVGGGAAAVNEIAEAVQKANEAKNKVQNLVNQGQAAAAQVQNAINQGKATVSNAQSFVNNNVPSFISNNLPSSKTTPPAQTNIIPPQSTPAPNPNAMIVGGSNFSLNPVQNQLPPTTANTFVTTPQESYESKRTLTPENAWGEGIVNALKSIPKDANGTNQTQPQTKKSSAMPIAIALLIGLGIYKASQNGGGGKPSMGGVPPKKAKGKTIKIKLS
jgi:chemotaxis regulatin CheY-phosphate phosphatase CheZ